MAHEEQKGLQLKYFVLKPAGNTMHGAACRAAMRTYATVIENANAALANELREWTLREEQATGVPDVAVLTSLGVDTSALKP